MSRKVLVVDDEKLIVKGIRFSLEQDGMEVDCAYDGEEALQKAKDNEYDIILLYPVCPCQAKRPLLQTDYTALAAKHFTTDKSERQGNFSPPPAHHTGGAFLHSF